MTSIRLPLIPWSKTRLLDGCATSDATRPVLLAVLDLAVLGYTESANRLINSLWEYSHGIEYQIYGNGISVMKAIYDFWKSTDSMPEFIKDPGPDSLFERGPMSRGYANCHHWQKQREAWAKGLPEEMREKALVGKLTGDDLKYGMKRMNRAPESWKKEDNTTIGAVIQVAMIAHEESVARDLVNKDVLELYRHFLEKWDDLDIEEKDLRDWLNDRLGLEYAPEIWNILKDTTIGKALEVDEKRLDAFVNEGCDLIKKRFTQGPARPYADTSMSDLVRMMDENYIAARTADPDSGGYMSILNIDHLPKSFLEAPATEDEISALEERLSNMPALGVDNDDDNDDNGKDKNKEDGNGKHKVKRSLLLETRLPDDYKEFLRTTNGFQVGKNDASGIFCSVDEVGDDDAEHLHDMEYTLFPYDYTILDASLDNISLGKFSCFSIGAGGDEGVIVLIPPSSVQPVLAEFEKAYAKANEKNKKLYERAALDLYGGLEAVRKLEWLVIASYHWNPDQQIYGSFRQYLEHAVGESLSNRKRDEKEAEKQRKKEAEEAGNAVRGEKRKSVGTDESQEEHKSQRTD